MELVIMVNSVGFYKLELDIEYHQDGIIGPDNKWLLEQIVKSLPKGGINIPNAMACFNFTKAKLVQTSSNKEYQFKLDSDNC